MTALPIEYGPLVQELLKRAALVRQPARGTFELTKRCNLSCSMCYVKHTAVDKIQQGKELSTTEWLSLTQSAVDNGMVFLLITGGEVFLRPDFFDIYEPLTRMGIILTVFTNGTLITKSVAQRLAESPPSRIEITLYGATSKTYETITGVSGSYARCCKGIEALASYSIPLGLKTTITQYNIKELEAMREMARKWGLPFTAGWLLSKRPDGAPSDVENCRLPVLDSITLEASDRAAANDWSEASLRESTTLSSDNFYCQAGKSAFTISPSGEMNICLDLPLPAVKPLQIGFSSAWTEVQKYRNSSPPMSPVCISCDKRVYCGRCPAWSLMENGTLTEPVPYLCEIAKARKERYGH